jgi:protein-L-isoaspartate(D-aspartate) O-methyltransferase
MLLPVMGRPAAGAIGVVLSIVAACAPEPRGELLTPPPAISSPAAATPRGATTHPTGSVAPVPAPGDLDRVLADSEAYRSRREALLAQVALFEGDARVLEAMRAVPRHAFVPTQALDAAYLDVPLPIGYGQTISQPSLVARMTALLSLEPGERVLEVGTGSGYQAAILAELGAEVYSVEIIPELAGTARRVLDALGYADVVTERRDGYPGWPEHAPYDAIVVTAAPDHLPRPLVEQLADDGRMVIPIGPVGDVQTLWLVTREGGEPRLEQLLEVRFVPLVREGG